MLTIALQSHLALSSLYNLLLLSLFEDHLRGLCHLLLLLIIGVEVAVEGNSSDKVHLPQKFHMLYIRRAFHNWESVSL